MIKYCKVLFYCFASLLATNLPAQQFLDKAITNGAQFTGTLNNLGCIGNAFDADWNMGQPSWEAPNTSGNEHIYFGGLWVGAFQNGSPRVSTGAADFASQAIPRPDHEFTSVANIQKVENDPNSPIYDPNAFADQELRVTFSDTSTSWGQLPIVDHTPMGLVIEMEAFIWKENGSNGDLSNIAFLNFTITNVSNQSLDSVYIGYWLDPVIRNTNVIAPGTPGFFNQGAGGYIDSLGLAYEFDSNGDTAFTENYLGLAFMGGKLNGSTPVNPNFATQFNSWRFLNSSDPVLYFPSSDAAKFAKMTTGLEDLTVWSNIEPTLNTPGNRPTLLSAGPFGNLGSGESLEACFAVIVAPQLQDGQLSAANTIAQRDSLIRSTNNAKDWYHATNCFTTPLLESSYNPLSLKVWPNPSEGQIVIDLGEAPTKKLEVNLIDLTGKVVMKKQVTQRTTQIEEVSPGYYVLVVMDDGQVLGRKKLVVQ